MRRILYLMIILTTLCGCTKQITTMPASNSDVDNTTNEITSTNESSAIETNTEYEELTSGELLQNVLLNKATLQYYPNEVTGDRNSEAIHLKDLGFDYYAFSMIDINFDGEKDVCLYSTTREDQFLRVLFVEEGKVYASGIQTYGTEVVDEGYAIAERENKLLVEKANFQTQDNDVVLRIDYDFNIFQYNGVEVTAKEAETHRADYSMTPAIKYDMTEENIHTYVK